MRTKIPGISAILFLVYFAGGELWCQSTSDEQAIKECAMNYIEGWYSADTARMAKALSKNLAKKGFLVHPGTGELTLSPAGYQQMIQWTGQKPDQLSQNPEIQIEVHLIEVGQNIAMVKTITPDFIDYLQLGKMKGQWKIYHAVWERPPGD